MKICIVTHNVIRGDGQGRVNYEITREALRRGHAVVLVADQVDPALCAAGADWIPARPRLRRVNLLKVWEFARRADRILDGLAGRVDLVHAYGFTTSRTHHVNTAQFVHDAWRRSPFHVARTNRNLYGVYQGTYSALNARWERAAYARARHVVAASGRVKSELVALGVPDGRVEVIFNGVDPGEFAPGTAAADRTALGLPAAVASADVPLALFAGDIRTNRKNLDTVLRALPLCPSVHLAVVGSLENSPYPALAARLGVMKRVHFLGFRRDVADLMRACDCFVFPSRYEPFGIVVLEAMACGKPVITAANVGAAEIITPEAGIVLPDGEDARALANALQSLLGPTAASRRAQMGTQARAIAEQHSWAHMAGKYLACYASMVAGGEVRAA